MLGGRAQRTWVTDLGSGQSWQNTLGVQLRHDRIRVGLFDTLARQVEQTVRDDHVSQSLLGLYAESERSWSPWLRTVAGLRADQLATEVTSLTPLDNSGKARAFKVSPKLSAVLGPWALTELFVNAGHGFHSNDARGTTARVDPKTGLPVASVPGLVGSRGYELGLKSQWVPGWQTAVALWQLDFDSELVYVGDAGNTEAGRPSRRAGLEWSNHWTLGEHLLVDANLAWSRPRYTNPDAAGNRIANAVQRVANLTLAWNRRGVWSGSVGVRYIGSAPLVEDNSVRSIPSVTVNLRLNHRLSSDWDVALDVLNLANRKNNDISYYYTSRVAGEPAEGVAGVHLHPADPRTLRVTARHRF